MGGSASGGDYCDQPTIDDEVLFWIGDSAAAVNDLEEFLAGLSLILALVGFAETTEAIEKIRAGALVTPEGVDIETVSQGLQRGADVLEAHIKKIIAE